MQATLVNSSIASDFLSETTCPDFDTDFDKSLGNGVFIVSGDRVKKLSVWRQFPDALSASFNRFRFMMDVTGSRSLITVPCSNPRREYNCEYRFPLESTVDSILLKGCTGFVMDSRPIRSDMHSLANTGSGSAWLRCIMFVVRPSRKKFEMSSSVRQFCFVRTGKVMVSSAVAMNALE